MSDLDSVVRIREPERAHLVLFLISSVLSRGLKRKGDASSRLGEVLLETGGMRTRIRFQDGLATIDCPPEGATAPVVVKGSLASMIDLCLGRRIVRHLASRRVRVRGSPRALLALLSLFRTACSPRGREGAG